MYWIADHCFLTLQSLSSTLCVMATVLPVLIVFVVIASLMTASGLFVPKGPHQV